MKKYRDKWWYSSPFILTLGMFSFFIIPGIIAIILLIFQMINRKSFYETLQQDELYNKPIREKEEELQKLNENNIHLETQIKENKKTIKKKEKKKKNNTKKKKQDKTKKKKKKNIKREKKNFIEK